MDPRELTELRELLEEQTAWEFFGQIPASDVVQYLEKLLADRDYQAQRAGRAEGESADLGLEFENATAHRDLLAAEIASLRAELDRKSLALLSAEQQLRWARDDGAKVREARDGARVETEDIRSALNTQRKLTDVAQAEVARLKAEVEQWRADALMYAELRDQVIEQRNALQAKLAEQGIDVDLDADVRRHREREAGLECSVEETTLRHCENELTEALGRREHDGWHSLLDVVKSERAADQAEITRLRTRVPVDAEEQVDFLARLVGQAITRATCIAPGETVIEDDEAIAGHALTTAVESLRERAEAAETDLELAGAEIRRLRAHALAEAEIARLRSRVRVEAEDVERARVTPVKCDAYMRAHGWEKTDEGARSWVTWEREADLSKRPVKRYDKILADVCFGPEVYVAECIEGLVKNHHGVGLDILDEMAALEVQS